MTNFFECSMNRWWAARKQMSSLFVCYILRSLNISRWEINKFRTFQKIYIAYQYGVLEERMKNRYFTEYLRKYHETDIYHSHDIHEETIFVNKKYVYHNRDSTAEK
jgi:hypothetical protein